MRGFLRVCSLIAAVVFFLSAPVWADMFAQASNVSGESIYRIGGRIYNAETTSGTKKAVDLGYSISNGLGCGSFNITSSLRAIFNSDAVKDFVKNVGVSAVQGAPLLLLSYMSPTLANTFMHLKNSADKILALRNAQCEAVQSAAMKAGLLMRAKEENKYRCMMEAQKEGMDINAAAERCLGATNLINKYVPLSADSDQKLAQKLNLTEEIKKLTGMDDEEYKLFKEAFGDITLNGNSLLDQQDKQAMNRIYDKEVEKYTDALDDLTSEVSAGASFSSLEPKIKKIYKDTGVYLHPDVLVMLANLKKSDPTKAAIYENMLANKLALYSIRTKLITFENDLRLAMMKSQNQGNESVVKVLKQKIADLKTQEEEIEVKSQAAQDFANFELRMSDDVLRRAAQSMSTSGRVSSEAQWNSLMRNSASGGNFPEPTKESESKLNEYMPPMPEKEK